MQHLIKDISPDLKAHEVKSMLEDPAGVALEGFIRNALESCVQPGMQGKLDGLIGLSMLAINKPDLLILADLLRSELRHPKRSQIKSATQEDKEETTEKK